MKKGLSSILGTVIILVLTLTAGAMLWRTFSGLFSSLSQQSQLQLESANYVDTTAGSYLSVTVRNTGTSSLSITGVTVEKIGSFTWAVTLSPGQEASNVFDVPPEPAGSSYLLVVSAASANGGSAQVSEAIAVTSD